MNNSFRILILALLATMCASLASAQFYTSRKHDQGTDTLWVYNSWESLYYNGPDTMAVNPNIEVMSPFNMKFKPTEKDNKPLRKMIEKETLAVSVGDSVWLINSRYLRDSLSGQYNKIFENYAPLYFNEKVAFITYGCEREWSVSVTDYLFGQKDFDGSTEVYPNLYYIDFINRKVRKVDHMVLSELLEDYHDLQVRFEGMKDYKKPYIITDFFFQFIDRATEDFMRPNILDLIN